VEADSLSGRIADSVPAAIPERFRSDVETLWQYHDMRHTPRRCDVGIGLGSHDLGVAVVATDLYKRGCFPYLVFTGANAPTTISVFPRGEAVHYREFAVSHGVPSDRVFVEPRARNTAENLQFTDVLLKQRGLGVQSVLLMSRPYQQRRAYATCKKLFPAWDVICYSNPLALDEYVTSIGDVKKVIDMLVGDTQRIRLYADKGFAIAQDIPAEVDDAYARLVKSGFVSRLVA
jgi:uncharacterized SAM-binding protein YcdF (DUF218 family)